MIVELKKFEILLDKLENSHSIDSIEDFGDKSSEDKWSKKEILGHLIDSAIYNIQRFTEIQYSELPYIIKAYKQDELVILNDYQNKNNQELYSLWLQLNKHVLHIVKTQTSETLDYQIILANGGLSNLRLLIEDYFDHLHHHLHQINSEWI